MLAPTWHRMVISYSSQRKTGMSLIWQQPPAGGPKSIERRDNRFLKTNPARSVRALLYVSKKKLVCTFHYVITSFSMKEKVFIHNSSQKVISYLVSPISRFVRIWHILRLPSIQGKSLTLDLKRLKLFLLLFETSLIITATNYKFFSCNALQLFFTASFCQKHQKRPYILTSCAFTVFFINLGA